MTATDVPLAPLRRHDPARRPVLSPLGTTSGIYILGVTLLISAKRADSASSEVALYTIANTSTAPATDRKPIPSSLRRCLTTRHRSTNPFVAKLQARHHCLLPAVQRREL